MKGNWGTVWLAILLAAGAAGGASRASAEHRDAPDRDWPTYGGDSANRRFSRLDQITTDNVRHLRVKWTFSVPDAGRVDNSLETTPLVLRGREVGLPERDAVMFVTSPTNRVFALDASNGELIWEARVPLREPLRLCCSRANRGVAYGEIRVSRGKREPRLYIAALDARLWAIEARTGRFVEEFTDGVGPPGSVTIADNEAGFSSTMAPLFIERAHVQAGGRGRPRDVVVVGISGGEFETRGFVTAYDARTGDRLWRFFTVPAPGEPGSETWPVLPSSDPFKNPFLRGGGSVWMTPAYDPSTGRLFLSVGNPSPNLDGTHRAGDNLFTNSVLALDLATGRRVWHYQEVHHDLWDYDPSSAPVLFDVDGTPAVGQAGKTGLFYILDRETGRPLFPCPETPVPASQVVAPDGTGEATSETQPLCGPGQQFVPFLRPGEAPRLSPSGGVVHPIFTPPSRDGVAVEPGLFGGSNWSPVAFHPELGLVFVSGIVQPGRYFAFPSRRPRPGRLSFGGLPLPKYREGTGTFTAIDVRTGTIRWQRKARRPLVGGALATAGGLVFYGEGKRLGGAFVARDAATGARRFFSRTRGGVNAAPITFLADGRQLVTVAAGGHLHYLNRLDDLIVTFGLPEKEEPSGRASRSERSDAGARGEP